MYDESTGVHADILRFCFKCLAAVRRNTTNRAPLADISDTDRRAHELRLTEFVLDFQKLVRFLVDARDALECARVDIRALERRPHRGGYCLARDPSAAADAERDNSRNQPQRRLIRRDFVYAVYMPISLSFILSPHGNISGNSNSLDSDISLLSIAADMSFAVFIDEIAQLCSAQCY